MGAAPKSLYSVIGFVYCLGVHGFIPVSLFECKGIDSGWWLQLASLMNWPSGCSPNWTRPGFAPNHTIPTHTIPQTTSYQNHIRSLSSFLLFYLMNWPSDCSPNSTWTRLCSPLPCNTSSKYITPFLFRYASFTLVSTMGSRSLCDSVLVLGLRIFEACKFISPERNLEIEIQCRLLLLFRYGHSVFQCAQCVQMSPYHLNWSVECVPRYIMCSDVFNVFKCAQCA